MVARTIVPRPGAASRNSTRPELATSAPSTDCQAISRPGSSSVIDRLPFDRPARGRLDHPVRAPLVDVLDPLDILHHLCKVREIAPEGIDVHARSVDGDAMPDNGIFAVAARRLLLDFGRAGGGGRSVCHGSAFPSGSGPPHNRRCGRRFRSQHIDQDQLMSLRNDPVNRGTVARAARSDAIRAGGS